MMAKSVTKSHVEQLAEALPLLIGKSRAAAVVIRAGKVDFVMRDIQVAAKNHRLAGGLFHQVLAKCLIPIKAVIEAAELILRVGRVHIHEDEVRILKRQYAAFAIVAIDAEADFHIERFFAREHRDAGIAGFFRGIPKIMITRKLQRELHLLGPRLGFLQAKNVGISVATKSPKPLPITARMPFTFHDNSLMPTTIPKMRHFDKRTLPHSSIGVIADFLRSLASRKND